jgi:hypothetical protein
MKKFLLSIACTLVFFSAGSAHAFKSSPFKGAYEINSQQAPAALDRQFLSIDVDTLEVMWARYAGGAFPPNLENAKSQPTLLIRFTGRDTNFFALEGNALIANGYMSLRSDDKQFEIRLRPDGKYDVAVVDKGVSTVYVVSRFGGSR